MAQLRPGSPELIRELNRAAILALIGGHGPIARVEIARRLRLSAATVTDQTRDLVAEGLIRVVDQAPSDGGRPRLLLGLVPDAAHAFGVKIAADHLVVVDVTLDGEPLEQREQPFDATAPDAITALEVILRSTMDRAGRPFARLLGIGLGVPGIVDPTRGVVDAPMLGWRGLAIGPTLRDRLGVPVLVDNDVNTLAVAERLYGRGRSVENFLTVTIGRGVGLGIVIGGDLYRGFRGGAGEFGHLPVDPHGRSCDCGRQGCLEALVADPALVSDAVEAGLVDAPASLAEGVLQLLALANTANRQAQHIYERAGAHLGRAVAGLVNVLSPELVLLGGEGTRAWAHLAASFDEALRGAIFGPLGDVAVEVDPWDDAKWARGAAALVLRATFAAPLYERQVEDSVRQRLVVPRAVEGKTWDEDVAAIGVRG